MYQVLFCIADSAVPITNPFYDYPQLPFLLLCIMLLLFIVIPAIVFLIIFYTRNKKKTISENDASNDPS